MAKKRKKIDTDKQGNLLDLLRQLQAESRTEHGREEGALNINERLRLAVKEGIRRSGLSRFLIAGEMSHLMGREVSKATIDTWTAESKDGHRIPGDAVPAFCIATSYNEPARIIAESVGLFALPGPDALRVEIRKLEEERRRVVAEKRKREVFLKEMEG